MRTDARLLRLHAAWDNRTSNISGISEAVPERVATIATESDPDRRLGARYASTDAYRPRTASLRYVCDGALRRHIGCEGPESSEGHWASAGSSIGTVDLRWSAPSAALCGRPGEDDEQDTDHLRA